MVTRLPMLDLVARIGLGIVTLVWLLTSCSSSSSEVDGGPGGGEAQAAKREMDALAEKLLPDLVPRLGEVTEMDADFVERGGYGLYDYRASAQVLRPAPRREALAEVERVLEEHGLTVESPGETSDVTGTLGNVRVSVVWMSGDAVDTADLTVNTLRPASGDDDYVADTGPTDYTTYLR